MDVFFSRKSAADMWSSGRYLKCCACWRSSDKAHNPNKTSFIFLSSTCRLFFILSTLVELLRQWLWFLKRSGIWTSFYATWWLGTSLRTSRGFKLDLACALKQGKVGEHPRKFLFIEFYQLKAVLHLAVQSDERIQTQALRWTRDA